MSSNASSRWQNTIIPKDIEMFLDGFWTLLDATEEEKVGEYSSLFTEDAVYSVSGIAEIQGRQCKPPIFSDQYLNVERLAQLLTASQ